MFILQLQNFTVCCCFITLININIKLVTSETNSSQKEFTDSNETCVKNFSKSGSYSLEIKEDCKDYYLNFDIEISSSIINLTTSINFRNQKENKWEKSTDSSTFNIALYEFSTNLYTEKEKKVLLKEWNENTNTLPCIRSYLSRSSKVYIIISGTGNWSYYEIHFSFKEIKYSLETLKVKDGRLTVPYKPNSVSLFRLNESQTTWRGVKIWFDSLSLNTEMGEYILIGAGSEPFKNEQLRPLYVSQVKENSTFYVDDSSAFVAFVSGSDPQIKEDFEILWEWIKEETVIIPEDPIGALNSSLICFYNYSEAIKEFEKPKGKRFETFKQHFLDIAKEYIPKEYKSTDLNLKKVSVDLFGKNSWKKYNDSVDALTIHVKVMYKGLSILTWRQLQTIIEESEQNSARIVGYKVGKCPDEPEYANSRNKSQDIIMYAMVPVFALFALMMWAWKQNLFSQNCLTEKEEKMSFGHMPAEPNPYETTTTPKTCRYDEEGRRETLIHDSLQQDDRDVTRDTIMVEMNAMPSTSQKQDILTRFLSGRNHKSRGSIKPLFHNTEELNKESDSDKIEKNESDHLYDSVSSSNELNETKL